MHAKEGYQIAAMDPPEEALGRPDLHWVAVSDDGRIGARCSLWWHRVPDLPGERLGLIGHYAADESDAASLLLERSCRRLSSEGCTLAVGPMDGDVWHRYRLLVERGTEPPFFLEPDNPDTWVEHFASNGFSVLAQYFSTAIEDLDAPLLRTERHNSRVRAHGIRLRHPDPSQWLRELRRLYPLVVKAFEKQFLFSAIDEDEFVSLYQPMLPVIRPELVFVAEHGDLPVGLVFAVPDMLQSRHDVVDSVVIQVVAVHPAYERYGMGMFMVQCCHDAARREGFRRVIHALMQENKASARLTGRYFKQRVIRRYALFSRRLNS